MYVDITGIDLLKQNIDKACGEVRLRCIYMHIIGIDSFKRNVGKPCG